VVIKQNNISRLEEIRLLSWLSSSCHLRLRTHREPVQAQTMLRCRSMSYAVFQRFVYYSKDALKRNSQDPYTGSHLALAFLSYTVPRLSSLNSLLGHEPFRLCNRLIYHRSLRISWINRFLLDVYIFDLTPYTFPSDIPSEMRQVDFSEPCFLSIFVSLPCSYISSAVIFVIFIKIHVGFSPSALRNDSFWIPCV
jgi:hypothetical protein